MSLQLDNTAEKYVEITSNDQGPLLLTWIDFNTNMDK